ncbi:MAG: autotransporter domain-containing protein [Candidatus Omnitrophica bacterium]|nr:autotransporter domain-containing protein [Candidatus Omnitrophota bacterium]
MRKSVFLFFIAILSCSSLCAHRAYGTDDWSFAVIGDTRDNDPTQTGVSQYLPIIAAKAASLNPTSVFVNGDLVNGDSAFYLQPYSIQFNYWKTAMTSLGAIPIYTVRGNHENEVTDFLPTSETLKAAYYTAFGSTTPTVGSPVPQNGPNDANSNGNQTGFTWNLSSQSSLNKKWVRVIGVDQYFYYNSTAQGTSHYYQIDQAWLNQQLKETAPTRYTFVMAHEPAYYVDLESGGGTNPEGDFYGTTNPDGSPNAQGIAARDVFWNSLGSNGVKMYLCCHVHNLQVGTAKDSSFPQNTIYQNMSGNGGAPLVTTPGTTDPDLTMVYQNFSDYGFALYTVAKDTISIDYYLYDSSSDTWKLGSTIPGSHLPIILTADPVNTWTGGGGADTDWATVGNWDVNAVPGITDTAVFNNGPGNATTVTFATAPPLPTSNAELFIASGPVIFDLAGFTYKATNTYISGIENTTYRPSLEIKGALSRFNTTLLDMDGVSSFKVDAGASATCGTIAIKGGTATLEGNITATTTTIDGTEYFTTPVLTINGNGFNTTSLTMNGYSDSSFMVNPGVTATCGTLTVQGGTATVGGGGTINVTNLDVAGGTLDIQTFNQTATNVQMTSGGISGTTGKLTSPNTFDMQSGTVSAILAGAGGLNKTGAGVVTLNAANEYTGATTITGGTLTVGNARAVSVGAVTNSATLNLDTAPLTITGKYTQNAGSTLALTANSASAGNFGSMTTAVVPTLDAASNVYVNIGGYIPNGATMTIVNTTGAGIAGNVAPGTINSSNPYVTFSGAISNNNLVLTANTNFSTATSSSNGAAVGAVLSNITNPSADMTTVLNALTLSTPGQVASSENSMTPATDGATTQASTAMLNNFVTNMETHLENVRTTGGATGIATGDDYLNGIDIWAQGLGDYAHQGPRGTSNGYNATSWGISGGADKSLCNDSFRTGLGTGYGQTFVRSKDFSGRTDIDSIPATIYCDYENNTLPFYVDAAFTFIYNLYNGSRQVTAGIISRTANADYNGQQYSGYVEGGYSFFYKNISLTPLASFQYMHLHTGSYTESNAGALDLSVVSQDYDMAQTGFGAKVACPFENKWGTLTPDLHFKWLYDWVGDAQASTASFAGGGSAFGTNGFSPAQSEWDFGVRLDFKTKYNVTLGLDYDFIFKADYYEHYGTLDVRYSF